MSADGRTLLLRSAPIIADGEIKQDAETRDQNEPEDCAMCQLAVLCKCLYRGTNGAMYSTTNHDDSYHSSYRFTN